MLPRFHASMPPCLPALLLFLLLFALRPVPYAQDTKPYVVMLSLDGFRWDYPEKTPTPNLDKIASQGVKAQSLQPVFPSKTFVNHYSMATGLYADHHGIVQNSFYDPGSGKHYSISDRKAVEDAFFYSGEPIWVTAEKQGIITGSYFWVGSEAAVEGIKPTYWKRYEHLFPFSQRIDTVIYWLSLPEEKRPHFITFYMHEPDGIGHDQGPYSEKTFEMVTYLDSLVGVFVEKVHALPIADQVNIIITSDHGMGEISKDRCIHLKDYLEFDWFEEMEGHSPNLTLKVRPEHADEAWKALTSIPHVTVWKHGEVPDSLHYGNNPRTLDYILVVDSAWQYSFTQKESYGRGAHGYNPYNKDMHAIFYATGPAFKEGHIQPMFENVNIYPLICFLLGIDPAPVDGKMENVSDMLKP